MMHRAVHISLFLFGLASSVAAQDSADWTALSTGLGPAPIAGGQVEAMAYGPDGTLYVGGNFETVGSESLGHLARWRPGGTGWEPVGKGTDGPIHALAIHEGRLYVGGDFEHAGGEAAVHVAILDLETGQRMEPVRADLFFNQVVDIAVDAQGVVGIVTGEGYVLVLSPDCSQPSEAPFPCWRSLGDWDGGANSFPQIETGDGGALVISNVRSTSGVALAAWMYASAERPQEGLWRPLGGGEQTASGVTVSAFAAGPAGKIAAISDGALTEWEEGAWSASASIPGAGRRAQAVEYLADGRVAVGTRGGKSATDGLGDLLVREGEAWDALAEATPQDVRVLQTAPNGALAVGGAFKSVGAIGSWSVTVFDNGVWARRGSAFAGGVNDIAVGPDGEVYAVGNFETAGQVSANGIARWEPSTGAWSAFGEALGDGFGEPYAVAVGTDGMIYVGGDAFAYDSTSGHTDGYYSLARWDPNTDQWSRFDQGFVSTFAPVVAALAVGLEGTLYAVGDIQTEGSKGVLYREPGSSSWSPTSSGAQNTLVGTESGLAVDFGGRLYAGGDFEVYDESGTEPGPRNVATWTEDEGWTAVDGGLSWLVLDVAVSTSGRVYAVGHPGEMFGTGAAAYTDGSGWIRLPV